MARSQIVLPLPPAREEPTRLVLGHANRAVVEALGNPDSWPYRTAVLTGPPRSGKSLLARYFVRSGKGGAVDDAQDLPENDLFHRWNRAQEDGEALLIVGGQPPWEIALPDLRSRMGAALQLEIGIPDDDMAADLIESLAVQRGLALPVEAAQYLIPRAGRGFAEIEALVAMIDRLSMERKVPPTLGIWRAALEAIVGPDEPRML